MTIQNQNDEYAHLPWDAHPDNPSNYPETANQFREKPTQTYEVSYEYADSIGAEYLTQSELEALGFDADKE